MKVIAINKKTREEKIIIPNISEKGAVKFCEMWGWNYHDENMDSWWLEIREDKNAVN